MGERGPAPSPPENLVGWRANENYKGSNGYKTPKPKKGSPPMPPDMSEGAREVWLRTLPLLEASRIITVDDGDVLHQYCVAVDLWRECYRIVNRDGFSRKGETGDRTYTTPEAQLLPRYSTDMQRLSNMLGLSPSARTRIQATPSDPEPPDDEAGKKQKKIKDEYGMTPE